MEIRWLELEQLFWTVKWKLCAKDGGGGGDEGPRSERVGALSHKKVSF